MEPAFARSRHRSTPSRGVSSAEANRAMCHRNSAHQDRVLKFQPTFSGKSLDGTTCPNCGRKPDEEAYSGLCYIFGISYDHHRFLSRGERDCPIRGDAMCRFQRRCRNCRLYRGNQENSGNWKLYYIRGKAWSEKQEYDKAVADYSEAITMDPKQVLPYFLRGTAMRSERTTHALTGNGSKRSITRHLRKWRVRPPALIEFAGQSRTPRFLQRNYRRHGARRLRWSGTRRAPKCGGASSEFSDCGCDSKTRMRHNLARPKIRTIEPIDPDSWSRPKPEP
jgi:tetratricopeptide (TPR) repeat protein